MPKVLLTAEEVNEVIAGVPLIVIDGTQHVDLLELIGRLRGLLPGDVVVSARLPRPEDVRLGRVGDQTIVDHTTPGVPPQADPEAQRRLDSGASGPAPEDGIAIPYEPGTVDLEHDGKRRLAHDGLIT